MEIRIDSKEGAPVPSPTQVVASLAQQLLVDQQKWLRQLTQDPGRLADLEVAVHGTFQQMADHLVASLLAAATQQSPALEAGKKK
jgi:hypothetical protein